MIYGIGIDIVHVERIAGILDKFSTRFPERILGKGECAEYQKVLAARVGLPENFLAKRFAAKEAFFKALGTGISNNHAWHDVEISHTKSGCPVFLYSKSLQLLFQRQKITASHLSISDEKSYAIAYVILERS